MKLSLFFFILILSSCGTDFSTSNSNWETTYFDSGEIYSTGLSFRGEKSGKWIFFRESGDTLSEQFYAQNELLLQINHRSDGTKFIEFYRDKKLNGPSFVMSQSGNMESISFFRDGNVSGHRLDLYPDGRIWSVQDFDEKNKTKNYKQYHANGFLEFRIDDYSSGNGRMRVYDSLGSFRYTIRYSNHNPIDTIYSR